MPSTFFDDYNKTQIKILADAVKDSKPNNKPKIIIFVGAGISMLKPYECSSWQKLANDLINECFVSKKLTDQYLREELLKNTDSKKKITIAHEILDDKLHDNSVFMETVRKSFNGDDHLQHKEHPSYPYAKLKKISNTIITTNADLYIDKYWSADNIEYEKFNTLQIGNLYKVHGSIKEPRTMIFTVTDYLKTYRLANDKDEKCLTNFFHKVFTVDMEYKILFVGYGLAEFEILDYLFKGITDTKDKFFLINGYYDHEQEIIKVDDRYYKTLGITQIIYRKNSKGYEGIHSVLDQIIDEGGAMIMANPYNDLLDALANPSESNINEFVNQMVLDSKVKNFFFEKFYRYKNLNFWFYPLHNKGLILPNVDNLQSILFLYFILQDKDNLELRVKKEIKNLINSWFKFFDRTIPDNNTFFAFQNLINLTFLSELPLFESNIVPLIEQIVINTSDADVGDKLVSFINGSIMPYAIEQKNAKVILKLISLLLDVKKYSIFTHMDYTLDSMFKNAGEMQKITDYQILELVTSLVIDYYSDSGRLFSLVSLEKFYFIGNEGYEGLLLSTFRHFAQVADKKIYEILIKNLLNKDIYSIQNKSQQYIIIRIILYFASQIKDKVLLAKFIKLCNKCKFTLSDLTFIKYELFHYLKASAELFSKTQLISFAKWLDKLNWNTDQNISEKSIAKEKKIFLLPFKSREETEAVFNKYNLIYPYKIDHPEFNYWIEPVREVTGTVDITKYHSQTANEVVEAFDKLIMADGCSLDGGGNKRIFSQIICYARC